MAIAEMKKLRLVGLASEKDGILDALLATGAVELKETAEIPDTFRTFDAAARGEAASRYARLTSALDFLQVQTRARKSLAKERKETYRPPKKPMFFCRRAVSAADFAAAAEREQEVLGWADRLNEYAAELGTLRSEENALQAAMEGLAPYACFPLPFSAQRESAHVRFLLGTVKEESCLAALAEHESVALEVLGKSGSLTVIFCAVHRSAWTEVSALLSNAGYTKCPIAEDRTFAAWKASYVARKEEIEARRAEITVAAEQYNAQKADLELLSDHYKFLLEKSDAEEGFSCTATTFVLEGFVPVQSEEKVRRRIEDLTPYTDLTFEEVTPADNPPTLCGNAALVTPFESITNMYSVPNYRERDPNLYVALFYFLFFGMMLSDAGYGLILAIGGFVLLWKMRMEDGMKNLVKVIAFGGISTVVWGVVFGGWLSLDPEQLATLNGLGWLGSAVQWLKQFQLIDPLDSNGMIVYLGMSLGLGFVQIMVGMGLKAAAYFKAGQPQNAVFEIFGWYAFFLGLILFAAGTLLPQPVLRYVGLAVLAAGLLVVLADGFRKGKGFGRITGALGGLYGIVNFLSDILSYSRLFGLGLATGVIGMVINTMISLFWNIPVIGVLFGTAVFVGGHIFNLAINVLGTYVHDARLQYIEFFGRFYEGGGHAFVPLGSNLNYITIKEPEEVSKV